MERGFDISDMKDDIWKIEVVGEVGEVIFSG